MSQREERSTSQYSTQEIPGSPCPCVPRFTPVKHAKQESPYANLLRPRAGGVAFVLETMGDMLQSIVDVTIVYPDGRPALIDLLANRVPEIRVRVQQWPIPPEFVGRDYENDAEFRSRFQAWASERWAEKDALIGRMQQERRSIYAASNSSRFSKVIE